MPPERPFGMAPTEMRQVEAPTAPRPLPLPQQLAAAVTGASDGRVEIRLDPEELGRVVLQMQSDGDRISLTITTERAEISDLLRRHLQELAQEFRALGYRSIDLGFGGGDGARSGAGRGQATPSALPTDASDDVPPQSVSEPAPGRAGLDLRL
ncbi:flagellar hook-length control protein FliK [Limimaricola variabilis]|nr:flagellar hook-length control protein FliK [Limimaricola variabilis]